MPKLRAWSNSSTTTFRRCTYKFDELYVQPKRDQETKRTGQALGSAGHIALKAFYLGKTTQEALEWAWDEFNARDEEQGKDFDRLRVALDRYWTVAARDNWKVRAVEKKVTTGRIMGILDLVAEDNAGIPFIADHKFQKSHEVGHLPVDTQVSFYLLLARLKGIKVNGLLYNIIPMSKEARFPIRRFVTRSNAYLDNFARELYHQVTLMDNFLEHPDPLRNFTKECAWDCDLYRLCLNRMEIPILEEQKCHNEEMQILIP